MSKFYLHSLPQPFHLSVGGVLFNDKLEICVHHFFTEREPDDLKYLSGGLDDFYHLMRESVEEGETLQQAVLRGIKEEFGADGVVERYLGPIECEVMTPTTTFHKTTLYHAVRLIEMGERPKIDAESESELEWRSGPDLLEIFRKQSKRTDRQELDESEVVKRFIAVYG